jgi:glycosyltransferase involved in cell wall biosynthesis
MRETLWREGANAGRMTEIHSSGVEGMNKTTNTRVIFYDPSGAGGVTHYTFNLAETMARLGSDITVVTTETYELEHLERHFRLMFLFKKSWVKMLVFRARTLFRRQRLNTENRAQAHELDHKSPQQRTGKALPILSKLRTLRLKITLLRAVVLFLVNGARVVHVQWLVNHKQDYAFIRLLGKLGFKIVYTAHDLVPFGNHSRETRETLARIYERVDRIIVHSQKNKRELIDLFPIEADRISVIPHGSYDFFRTEKSTNERTVREELGIPKGKRVILFFGLIRRYKGLEYLVEAFEQVRARMDNVMLLVVGKIFSGNSEEFQYYSDLIDQLRGHDDIRCVPEYVPLEKVDSYFSAADLVALPYTKSYTSGILLAAYAAGKPVVVTDTGGLSEVVEEGKSGAVVPPRDATALANAIIDIFQTPGKLTAMGQHAKYLGETTYSWKGIAIKTLSLYQGL